MFLLLIYILDETKFCRVALVHSLLSWSMNVDGIDFMSFVPIGPLWITFLIKMSGVFYEARI